MKILLTGGSGRLGAELRDLLPGASAPPRTDLDVTDLAGVLAAVGRERPDVIVHCAAYTSVSGAERERQACWQVNVVGTRHMAAGANSVGATLVQISTDYVFSGEQGDYREDDPPGPPVNYYALTKLVAEEAARAARHHLILRTSFRPRDFPYSVAYRDLYTSQDYVDVLAPDLALAVRHAREIPFTTLHVATERKSVFELARRRRPEVREGTRAEAGVRLPADISLNTERWQRLKESGGLLEPSTR